MAMLWCTYCQHLKEVADQYIGKVAKCPACQKPVKIFNTLQLIKSALSKIKVLTQENKTLQQHSAGMLKEMDKLTQENQVLHQQFALLADEGINQEEQGYAFANMAFSAQLNRTEEVINWFELRQIRVEPNQKAADISGFFDEVAVMLGDNYSELANLLNQIRYHQRKGYVKLAFKLANKSENESRAVKTFCKQAFKYAFFARHYVSRDGKFIDLILQTTPQIVRFFDGEWLEWYALMKVASLLTHKNIPFSCIRSSEIFFANGDKNELDLFIVFNYISPLWIECKSGEFRDSIGKYQSLRKRIGIEKRNAIVFVLGVRDEELAGLSSMFDMTFVNEKTLLGYLSVLF
jgi:hypothetical protein